MSCVLARIKIFRGILFYFYAYELTDHDHIYSRALYNDQPVFELEAHSAKLNNCMFSQNDLYVSHYNTLFYLVY